MAFFVVEGNIGVGKSTFLKMAASYLNAQLVFEPHEKWQDVGGQNLLDAFYKDGSRWAYTFQTYAFITRVLEQENRSKVNDKAFQLVERSVYSDRYCFAKNSFEIGIMNELEWKLYKEWFAWFVENRIEQPAGFIYLRANPEICYDRLVKRSRSEESSVKLDYLKLLHNKHEDWLVHKKGIAKSLENRPILILDCNESFESDIELQKKHINAVRLFLERNFTIPAHKIVLPEVVL